MMPRAEYLTAEVFGALWEAIGAAFSAEQAESGAAVQEFLKRLSPAWNVVGGVDLHLAREPQGRRGALCLPRHLHEPALDARPGPWLSTSTRVRPTRSGSSCSSCRSSAPRSTECPMDS